MEIDTASVTRYLERALKGASGLEVDPDAYRWWKGLAQVKAQGIWQGAVRAFMDGTTGELSQAMIAVRISVLQDQETLREIGWSDESG